MIRFDLPSGQRALALRAAAVTLVALSPACATAPVRDAPGGSVAAGVEPANIPPPPDGLSAAVEDAWADLQAGGSIGIVADPSAHGRTLAGFGALRVGDLGGALSQFEAALEVEPRLAHAAYGIGLVALAQGNVGVAGPWFERALDFEPTLVRAAVQLRILAFDRLGERLRTAESAERDGDLEAAVAAYTAASEAAPDVAALYLRLAAVEEARGATDAAVAALERGRRRAGDAPALLLRLGQLYRATERYAEAYEVLRSVRELLPDDADLAALTEDTRRRYEAASLPPEYLALGERDTIRREELAAILAIELEGLEPPAPRDGVIVSDIAGRWSAPFVQRMVEWGVLDVYQNNAFWPDLEVTRSMVVEAAFRIVQALDLAEAAPRPRIQDPPPEHLLYRAVQTVVGLGVMDAEPDGSFDLLEPVSGDEAMRAAERLASSIRRLES